MCYMYNKFFNVIKSLFLINFLFIGNFNVNANDFGFFGAPLSSIYTNINGTPTNYTADVFNDQVLGSLSVFNITGGHVQTYKNGAGNVCAAKLYYTIYLDGGSKGAFTPASINYKGELGSGDQELESR